MRKSDTLPAMIKSHGDEPADKLEVGQMFGIDIRGRVDLQTVVVLVGILEQAVHGVKSLMGHQEEPLAAHAPVIQALFALEHYVEATAQFIGR